MNGSSAVQTVMPSEHSRRVRYVDLSQVQESQRIQQAMVSTGVNSLDERRSIGASASASALE
jgi:hypothetical protein